MASRLSSGARRARSHAPDRRFANRARRAGCRGNRARLARARTAKQIEEAADVVRACSARDVRVPSLFRSASTAIGRERRPARRRRREVCHVTVVRFPSYVTRLRFSPLFRRRAESGSGNFGNARARARGLRRARGRPGARVDARPRETRGASSGSAVGSPTRPATSAEVSARGKSEIQIDREEARVRTPLFVARRRARNRARARIARRASPRLALINVINFN